MKSGVATRAKELQVNQDRARTPVERMKLALDLGRRTEAFVAMVHARWKCRRTGAESWRRHGGPLVPLQGGVRSLGVIDKGIRNIVTRILALYRRFHSVAPVAPTTETLKPGRLRLGIGKKGLSPTDWLIETYHHGLCPVCANYRFVDENDRPADGRKLRLLHPCTFCNPDGTRCSDNPTGIKKIEDGRIFIYFRS